MFASNNLSAADVAAVTGGNRNNGFGDGDHRRERGIHRSQDRIRRLP